ncbi:MAG TPA: BadF/BadG/BcrA/BcrD ATPase family protein [Azospirillaceae bacterium]|nr:BadF/BadG/BcrA/BcrD ATPase family protein [Azospirillaceae bacterium]
MSADLLMGVDGGGTRCRVRIRRMDGTLVGEAVAGPANIRLGLETAWAAILDAAARALAGAGLSLDDALPRIRAGLGLAGICGPEDSARILEAGPRLAGAVAETDAFAACMGAFAGRDGAILIAGTGSAGYALVGGKGHAVGGWGFEVSDGGSGASIGREAVRRSLRAHDGLEAPSPFTRAVMDRLGGTPASVVAWAGAAKPGDFGGFAPLVLEHAGGGDPVAAAIVAAAAADLSDHIRALTDLGAPSVCLMGGLADPITPWLPPWARRLLSQPEGDALDGALLMARTLAHSPSLDTAR